MNNFRYLEIISYICNEKGPAPFGNQPVIMNKKDCPNPMFHPRTSDKFSQCLKGAGRRLWLELQREEETLVRVVSSQSKKPKGVKTPLSLRR